MNIRSYGHRILINRVSTTRGEPHVEPEDTREIIDIKELIAEIESIVMRQSQLRDAIDEIVKDLVEEFVDSVTVTTAVDEGPGQHTCAAKWRKN